MRLTIYVLQLSGISTVTCAVVTTICTALSSSQTETLHPLSSSSLSPPSSPSQSPSCFCLCEVSSKWTRPRFVLCVWIISLGTVSLRFIRIAARIWNSFLSLCVCVCVCVCELLSCVLLFATPWTIAHQAPPSMEFPRQDTGVCCYFLFQGIFPTQGLNPSLLDCGQTPLSEPPGEPPSLCPF